MKEVGIIREKRGSLQVEWEIEEFFSYTKKDEYLESPSFFIAKEKEWWLQLYPRGKTGARDYISFHLYEAGSSNYHIACTFGILKRDNSVFYSTNNCKYDASQRVYGCSRFLLRSDLLKSKDIVENDGALRVFCILRIVENAVTETACGTCSVGSFEILSQDYKNLYLGGRLSDVTLVVKDKDFQAHKGILAARSPVFAAMFEHDTLEKSSNAVNITDCDLISFNEFLIFLYTGKLENVSPRDVSGLYETANKYDVKELQEECVQLMEHNLSTDTFSDTVAVALKYKESELLKSATEFFIENAGSILPTGQWQMFLAGNPSLANELLIKVFKTKPI